MVTYSNFYLCKARELVFLKVEDEEDCGFLDTVEGNLLP